MHFGDQMVLMNPSPKDRSRPDLAVSVNVPMQGTVVTDCFVSASNLVEPIYRTCFSITRCVIILKINRVFLS